MHQFLGYILLPRNITKNTINSIIKTLDLLLIETINLFIEVNNDQLLP